MKQLLQIILVLSISTCFGQTTLTDITSGCNYSLPWSCDGCTLKWTGQCVDSMLTGNGRLTVSYENQTVMEYNGQMSNGVFNGVGKYVDGMNEMEGLFVNGYLIASDTTLLDNLEKVIVDTEDPHNLYINDGNNNTQLFYYKMVPETTPKGVLVIIPSGGEMVENLIKQISLHKTAFEKGLMVIFPSINWGSNDRVAENALLDTIFQEVVEEYDAPKDKFILCGLSNGGMISLTYSINAIKHSNTFITPKGIIGLDPPLDFTHCYKYCEREIERDFTPAGVAEAKWMLNNFNTSYGNPEENPEKYIEVSPFSYGVESGGNAKYLTNIAVRMYSDLNIDYLLNKRKRDLYDWNGTDVVAFVNQLKINGNTNADVIISQNKGYRYDGTIHPHSWTIMDTDETMNWILELIE